ncbi:hypothetical protein SAMN06297422_11751 [Lachnospiraceae bacterium]|nr:hypothetical protein SAMN06297422_11751 [Lachnospiraceae bacterium]
MDRYDERIIKGKTEVISFVWLVLSILVAALGLALLILIPSVGVIIFALGVFLITFTKDGLNIEYEYIITNGDIEISKIVAKKRRKLMKEIEASNVTKIDYASTDQVKNDLSLGQIKVKKFLGSKDEGKLVAVYSGEGEKATITLLDLNDKCVDHLKTVFKIKCNL